MPMKKTVIFCLFISLLSQKAFSQKTIEAKDAAKHINETVTICDKVYGGKYFGNSNITLLDVGGAHPNEYLTLVIKGDDNKKFKGHADEIFRNKKICVTGKIIDYKGKPEMEITEPDQIKELSN
jgi:micrococcal nuclease